jgi:hypothetical protein
VRESGHLLMKYMLALSAFMNAIQREFDDLKEPARR